MSHHSEEPFDSNFDRILREMRDTTSFRGAIGSFPAGKLTKADEGSIQFAVGEKDGKVVIDFGTPVAWVGMRPQEAADLANTLFRWARNVGRKNGETISVTIGG